MLRKAVILLLTMALWGLSGCAAVTPNTDPGAPFGSCNTHTFTFTPATGTSRAIIDLTSGPNFAAFIGFMVLGPPLLVPLGLL